MPQMEFEQRLSRVASANPHNRSVNVVGKNIKLASPKRMTSCCRHGAALVAKEAWRGNRVSDGCEGHF